MELIRTSKGGQQLSLAGYLYSFNGTNRLGTRWRCVHYYGTKCGGRVQTSLDGFKVIENSFRDHSHNPDHQRIVVSRLRAGIRASAKSSLETPSRMIDSAIKCLPKSARSLLPSERAMTRQIQRARRKHRMPESKAAHPSNFQPDSHQPSWPDDSKNNETIAVCRLVLLATVENIRQPVSTPQLLNEHPGTT